MSIVRYTNEEIRKRKVRIDHAKVRAATEEQIAAWKREDACDEMELARVRVVPPVPDVRALRERLGLSQEHFAERYMLGLRTVQEWEQRRREPSEAARTALRYCATRWRAAFARTLDNFWFFGNLFLVSNTGPVVVPTDAHKARSVQGCGPFVSAG